MSEDKASEIIAMAWCDKTAFETIREITGLSEEEVIEVMRKSLKRSSFRLWRKRVSGRNRKHRKKYEKPDEYGLI